MNSPNQWGKDYYESLDFCTKRNKLLPSSSFCQTLDKNSGLEGQITWTNVFREQVEIIQTQGK